MDDYPGQNQTPVTPPPPAYAAPTAPQTPAAPPSGTMPPQGYAPQPGYAPPATPPKKKTWLWVVIGIVVLGLIGCGVLAAVGLSLFKAGSEPAASIEAINQAALDADTVAFEKYFDAESVSSNAYGAFIDYVKSTEDYASIVAEMGEEEADRILREEIMPEDTFVSEMAAEFSIDGLGEGQVPFPEYTVTSSAIDNDTAELTVVTIEDGEEVTYVLGMVKETVGDEDVWRVVEIKNIADMLQEDLGVSE